MVSDGSEAGFQAGGPVAVRAVPTALRWKMALGSPPGTIAPPCASSGLVGGWPQQRRFGRRQPKRRLDQRGPRQYAECHRLGRVQPGGRSFACDAVVRDGGLWGAVGRSGRPLEGQQGSCGRGEDQDGDEPRRQPRLQPLTSMRPRTHRHPGSPPAATGGRPIAAPVGGRRAWSRPGAASSSMNRGSDRACPPIRRAGPISARRRRSAASRCDLPLRQLRVYSP